MFKGSIEQIHKPNDMSSEAGHPIEIMKRENRAIEALISGSIKPHLKDIMSSDSGKAKEELTEDLELLSSINIH